MLRAGPPEFLLAKALLLMGVWILPCPAEKGGAWFPQEMPEGVLCAAIYGCPGARGDTVRPGVSSEAGVCVLASVSAVACLCLLGGVTGRMQPPHLTVTASLSPYALFSSSCKAGLGLQSSGPWSGLELNEFVSDRRL